MHAHEDCHPSGTLSTSAARQRAIWMSFFASQLRLGMTLAAMASDPRRSDAQRRESHGKAAAAHACVLRFLAKTRLAPDDESEVWRGVDQLVLAMGSIRA